MTSISLKISACGREIGRGIVVLGTLFFGSTAWSQNLQQFEDQPDTVPPHLNSPQMLNLPNIAWPKGDATMQPGWTADNPGRVPFLGAPNVNGSFDGLHSTQNGFHNPSFPYPSYPNNGYQNPAYSNPNFQSPIFPNANYPQNFGGYNQPFGTYDPNNPYSGYFSGVNQASRSVLQPPSKPVFSGETIRLVCPPTEAGTVKYRLISHTGGYDFNMTPASKQDLKEDRTWKIAFEAGNGQQKTYTLKAGTYNFRHTTSGWDLFRQNAATDPAAAKSALETAPQTITIARDGSLWIGQEQSDLAQLEKELAQTRAVTIQGDPAAPYQTVAAVVNLCKRLGIEKVDFSAP